MGSSQYCCISRCLRTWLRDGHRPGSRHRLGSELWQRLELVLASRLVLGLSFNFCPSVGLCLGWGVGLGWRLACAQAKADTLNNLALQYGIPKSQTIALGDGANDLVMMEQAGLGVAYHAKPVVRQQADAAIRFGAADGLLAYLRR